MQLKSDITTTNPRTHILTDLTEDEKISAKKLAKSKGMTFQGWLGQLIRRELEQKRKEASDE